IVLGITFRYCQTSGHLRVDQIPCPTNDRDFRNGRPVPINGQLPTEIPNHATLSDAPLFPHRAWSTMNCRSTTATRLIHFPLRGFNDLESRQSETHRGRQ